MANRKRNTAIYFMVSPEEKQQIEEKMVRMGTKNMGAYLRKMALDGYSIRLDLADLKTLLSLLRNATNNLNQIARRANETYSIYAEDIKEMQDRYASLWETANDILLSLAKIK